MVSHRVRAAGSVQRDSLAKLLSRFVVGCLVATSCSCSASPNPADPSMRLSGWRLVESGALGAPCPPAGSRRGPAPAFPEEPVCGEADRVSLQIVHHAAQLPPGAPCEPRVLYGTEQPAYEVALCTAGDELVLSSRCVACRVMFAGEMAHARLSELTREQHERLAKIAGLRTPPGDGDAWRALAARAVTRPQASATPVAPP
jgi:hypothetical protein